MSVDGSRRDRICARRGSRRLRLGVLPVANSESLVCLRSILSQAPAGPHRLGLTILTVYGEFRICWVSLMVEVDGIGRESRGRGRLGEVRGLAKFGGRDGPVSDAF